MATEEEVHKAATDPVGLERTRVAAESISRMLVHQREQLHKDLAGFEESKLQHDAKRAALDAEWGAFNQERAKHRDVLLRHEQTLEELATHELALHQHKRELDARELRLNQREEKLGLMETEFQRRNATLSDRQGAVERGEQDLRQKQELHRVGMHRIKALVEEFFRAPGH